MVPEERRIVILGGGFGGVFAAKRLERIFAGSKDVEILLISEQNYLLFTPMLPEVPSSSIEAKHIVSPIRAFLRKANFMNAEVLSIDLRERTVSSSHCPACGTVNLSFDHLVLAFGSSTNFLGLPGVSEHAMPMKTLSDAMSLRNHIIDLFEHADMQMSPEARKAMLTFVVAGGGFAGVETVAEIGNFIHFAVVSTGAFDPKTFAWCWCIRGRVSSLRSARAWASTPLKSFARAESRSFSKPKSLPQHLEWWS